MSVCTWPLLWKVLLECAELHVMKGSCIFFHDFRMVQPSLAKNFLPLRAKLACTASAQFNENRICSFSWSKIRNVFCAGKNWNYICQNGTRFNVIDIVLNFMLFNISAFIWFVLQFVDYLNNWTRSHFGSSARTWGFLPSRPHLFVCCVVYYLLVRLL